MLAVYLCTLYAGVHTTVNTAAPVSCMRRIENGAHPTSPQGPQPTQDTHRTAHTRATTPVTRGAEGGAERSARSLTLSIEVSRCENCDSYWMQWPKMLDQNACYVSIAVCVLSNLVLDACVLVNIPQNSGGASACILSILTHEAAETTRRGRLVGTD